MNAQPLTGQNNVHHPRADPDNLAAEQEGVDPDALSYNALTAVGELVGTVSKGLSQEVCEQMGSLATVCRKKQHHLPTKMCHSMPPLLAICRQSMRCPSAHTKNFMRRAKHAWTSKGPGASMSVALLCSICCDMSLSCCVYGTLRLPVPRGKVFGVEKH